MKGSDRASRITLSIAFPPTEYIPQKVAVVVAGSNRSLNNTALFRKRYRARVVTLKLAPLHPASAESARGEWVVASQTHIIPPSVAAHPDKLECDNPPTQVFTCDRKGFATSQQIDFNPMSRTRACLQTARSPQAPQPLIPFRDRRVTQRGPHAPPLKKGGESPQSPPVLLEVLGKLSLHPCIRALFNSDARGIFLSLSAITSSLLHTP